VGAGVCYWWGHDRYPNVCLGRYQTNFGRQPCLRIRGEEGRSHQATPWLPRRRGVVMVKLGYTNPPRLWVKRRLQKLDADTLKAAPGTRAHLRGLSTRRHDQWTKTTYSRYIRIGRDVYSPRGGMGEANAHRPKSETCSWRVWDNFRMYNAGLFSSDAHCGDQCENVDTERVRGTSRYSSRNESMSRQLEMWSTSWIDEYCFYDFKQWFSALAWGSMY